MLLKRINSKGQGRLVVRLALQPEEDQFWWLPPASAAREVDEYQARELSRQTPAEVLLDARGLRLDWLELPPGVKANEAELLLEDLISQPLEEVDVLTLQKKGRRLQTATLEKTRAQAWQDRVDELGLKVKRWLPENLPFASAAGESDLLIEEAGLIWYYRSASDELLVLPAGVYQQSGLADEAAPVESNSLASGALVPFLAEYLPAKINLWPRSPLQSFIQPLQQLKHLRAQLPVALPWVLILVLLAGQAVMPGFSGQQQANQAEQLESLSQELLGEILPERHLRQQVERRLELIQEHRQWQSERLQAWEELQALLARHSHLKLAALTLNENGVSARLQGVEEADQAHLRQLDGRWNFTDEQADWEKSL